MSFCRRFRLRACIRIGELSRDLERDVGGRPSKTLPNDEKSLTKAEQLAEVGIPVSTAHRYEEFTGGHE